MDWSSAPGDVSVNRLGAPGDVSENRLGAPGTSRRSRRRLSKPSRYTETPRRSYLRRLGARQYERRDVSDYRDASALQDLPCCLFLKIRSLELRSAPLRPRERKLVDPLIQCCCIFLKIRAKRGTWKLVEFTTANNTYIGSVEDLLHSSALSGVFSTSVCFQ